MHKGPGVEGARSIGRPQKKTGVLGGGGGGEGRARSDGAFPALLRKWEFKPPFPVKHYEASNSPLKMLSETASELP